MKNLNAVHGEQLHKMLYVVFPKRERQTRNIQTAHGAAYVWGKRDLRCLING